MLQVNVNSYISYDEAAVYFDDRLHKDVWTSFDYTVCEKALIMASRRIDTLMLSGVKSNKEQAMEFPRTVTNGVVPDKVKYAVCEEALYILPGTDKRAELQAAGVDSYGIGDLSESFKGKGSFAAGGLQSIEAMRYMRGYLNSYGIV